MKIEWSGILTMQKDKEKKKTKSKKEEETKGLLCLLRHKKLKKRRVGKQERIAYSLRRVEMRSRKKKEETTGRVSER